MDRRYRRGGPQWTLADWYLEGEPGRTEVDANGIPCELLFDPAVVAELRAGGSS